MKISTKGEYALRALIVLGQNRDAWLSVGELSRKTLVSEPYLEKILLQLKKMDYVESKRGHQGGFNLLREPDNINLGEVIRQLEGPLAPMGCASITKYEPCELEVGCLLKPLWVLIREVIAHVLEQTTLQHLLDGQFYLNEKDVRVPCS
ncbi:Rrf2 family transcriptional regulator [Paenibacillus sp. SYP-B3998]|uniref:Rrf2 family transcriptional regulator n=1 Tax=Paenibacillus sp. SYP-B3998 TaxID=2678564 RepID=A0A6G3ZZR9_9BACL|nr:Rrf2 family transcriptional regulator [Paenibacillus sp. SYP-B3998]NEW07071.1 Rrf2 family transcriptional regulator [Paenibacillus sp. SYP-B3998]